MCSICEKVEGMSAKAALRLVGEAMKKGARSKCLDALVGKLVGEELPEYDAERDGEWEVGHR